MTTIYEKIREYYDGHRKLLARIADPSGDSAERQSAWDCFYYDFKSHAAAEEEAVYSKLIEPPHSQDEARHSNAEHKELDDIIEELNDMDMSSPGWLTRCKTLKQKYEHHMEEEEEDIFSKARKVLSDDKDGTIAERFSKRKREELDLVDQKADESLEE